MKLLKRIYVAGLFSRNECGEKANTIETLNNIRRGLRLSVEVLLADLVPFTPWLDFMYFLMLPEGKTISESQIKKYSMSWLEVSDTILLVPGWESSPGTRAELERADGLGIPRFNKLQDILDYNRAIIMMGKIEKENMKKKIETNLP